MSMNPTQSAQDLATVVQQLQEQLQNQQEAARSTAATHQQIITHQAAQLMDKDREIAALAQRVNHLTRVANDQKGTIDALAEDRKVKLADRDATIADLNKKLADCADGMVFANVDALVNKARALIAERVPPAPQPVDNAEPVPVAA